VNFVDTSGLMEGGIEMNPVFDPVWIGAGILSCGLINSLRGGAKLGNKLDVIFGKATGSEHKIKRSKSMLRQLQRIGIFDKAANRAYLKQHLNEVLKDPSNIISWHCFSMREPSLPLFSG